MKSRKTLTVTASLAMLCAALVCPAFAGAQNIYQPIPFASTPNPVGSGGRAVAWGGAFIAVADDATAANWNPGGLTQLLLPEASLALSYHTRIEDMDFMGYNADSESEASDAVNLNYASIVAPFNVEGVNMVFSLNYLRLYEFDRDLEYTVTGVNAQGFRFNETRSLEQSGAISSISPAFCIQIVPQWSLGVAYNAYGLDHEGSGWKQQWQVYGTANDPNAGGAQVRYFSENLERYDISGDNLTVGTMVKIQNLTIGAVYKSELHASVDFDARQEVSNVWPTLPARNDLSVIRLEDDQTLVFPESYGVGLSYRFTDAFSVAADGYYTAWSNYELQTDGGDQNPLAGGDPDVDIEDTWQFRAGAEYLWIQPKYVFALRGGAFYDPEQIQDEVNDFYGVAMGPGIVYRNFAVDGAVQYKWANEVKGEKVEGVTTEKDVQDWMAIVSLIYHF